MKRRKNPIYTGQRKRASTGTGSNRTLVYMFYAKLNEVLRPEDEIEIIPLDQVNPTHSAQDQALIIADYCVRKILPELTSLFHWGDEVTPQLRALAPIVDQETAKAASDVAYAVVTRAVAAAYDAAVVYDTAATFDVAAFNGYAAEAVHHAAVVAHEVYRAAFQIADRAAGLAAHSAVNATLHAARCVYHALVAIIEADHAAAYNRIIELTNEMLESL